MNEKRKSVFMGNVYEEKFSVYSGNIDNHFSICNREPCINKTKKFIENREFYACDLDVPPLERGEELYINDLNLTVTIEKKVRSVNGEDIYYTNHLVELLEASKDEEDEANKKYKTYIDQYNKNVEMQKDKFRKQNKKWYQFWR